MSNQDQYEAQVEEGEILSPDEMRDNSGGPRDSYESQEMTTWDGAGNPIKHHIGQDADGNLSEGTGPTSEAAADDAADPDHVLGDDVTPGMASEGSGPGEPLG